MDRGGGDESSFVCIPPPSLHASLYVRVERAQLPPTCQQNNNDEEGGRAEPRDRQPDGPGSETIPFSAFSALDERPFRPEIRARHPSLRLRRGGDCGPTVSHSRDFPQFLRFGGLCLPPPPLVSSFPSPSWIRSGCETNDMGPPAAVEHGPAAAAAAAGSGQLAQLEVGRGGEKEAGGGCGTKEGCFPSPFFVPF